MSDRLAIVVILASVIAIFAGTLWLHPGLFLIAAGVFGLWSVRLGTA